MLKMIYQIVYLAICIYHEARGEPADGQVAVGHVIMNRVAKSDKSVKDVVFSPWQFSWANAGQRPPISDYESFAQCINSAMICLQERLEGMDFNGANHYFAEYIPKPEWANKMKFLWKIGKHLFYKG